MLLVPQPKKEARCRAQVLLDRRVEIRVYHQGIEVAQCQAKPTVLVQQLRHLLVPLLLKVLKVRKRRYRVLDMILKLHLSHGVYETVVHRKPATVGTGKEKERFRKYILT